MSKFENEINKLIGKGNIDKALAWEWLKKGLGIHKIPEDSILFSQGYRFVQVKVFIEWGKQYDLGIEKQKFCKLAKIEDSWAWRMVKEKGFDRALDDEIQQRMERNEFMKNAGYIDVHFVEGFCDKKQCGKACHWEFQITCSGHGGTTLNKFTQKQVEEILGKPEGGVTHE